MSDILNENGAIFSPDRKYRYVLYRMWEINKPTCMFIGLNPSTATETKNDPTITRVMKFAFDWDYGGVYMMNLFGLVTPYPEDLKKHPDPVGENDKWLEKAWHKSEEAIFCWGAFPEAQERAKKVIGMFPGSRALVINKDGTPRHPLYVPANVKPVPFTPYVGR